MSKINNIPTVIEYTPGTSTYLFPDLAMTPKNYRGYYFEMRKGDTTPAAWSTWFSNNDNMIMQWDNNRKRWYEYSNRDPKNVVPGHYYVFSNNNSSTSPSTVATASTTAATTPTSNFTSLNLGIPLTLTSLQTSSYGFDWYKANKDKLKEYQKLGETYNSSIKNQDLDYTGFQALQKFLNPDVYAGMDTNGQHGVEESEYEAYMSNPEKKSKFYSRFNDNSWLGSLGKDYYNFFDKNNGISKIQAYNDHLRMLYGSDLVEGGNNDNATAVKYIKDTPAYIADDRYKLANAYNTALQNGDYNTARRLSLYMTKEGISHYGYGDHFDLGHLQGRWNRKLSNGKTVGEFLDWIYDYARNNNVDSEIINNIVRNATKYNFDLTPGFWNKLGANGVTIKDAYAAAHLPIFKQGGKFFNMLFV